MANKTIVSHSHAWPIAISTIYGTHHSDEMLAEAYAEWSAFMVRGPHVLVVDMTRGNAGATPKQRASMADWVKRNEGDLRARKQLAHVLVVNSAVVRGIITAVAWLKPPANPQYVTASMQDAIDYAMSTLRGAGVEVPRSLGVSAVNLISL